MRLRGSRPSSRTNYFSAHDGGRLCLRADHPAERPDRSADLPDPPETTEDDIRHTIQRMYQYARALKKERVSNFS